jgi:hypothetical protein
VATTAMTGVQYETVVREIVESIVTTCGIPPNKIGHGKTNRWKGASGYAHQIDVSVRGGTDIVLIECKCWKKPIPIEMVLVLVGRVTDIRPTLPANIGFQAYVVSRERVTEPAEQVAKHFNIELARVTNPQEFALRYKDRLNLGLADSNEGNLTDDFRLKLFP